MIHLQHMVNIMNNPNMYKTKKIQEQYYLLLYYFCCVQLDICNNYVKN